MVKSRYIGDGHPTFNRNPYNGYINPYYWVDDHPLLYGNNEGFRPWHMCVGIQIWVLLRIFLRIFRHRVRMEDFVTKNRSAKIDLSEGEKKIPETEIRCFWGAFSTYGKLVFVSFFLRKMVQPTKFFVPIRWWCQTTKGTWINWWFGRYLPRNFTSHHAQRVMFHGDESHMCWGLNSQ